ncbi:MAG: sugar phosphate isomerase/epimerase [Phycisphaerae bacterium]|jgi:sugar phosphate isomerase/epimerase|nr:sugar phosphate isomerase/epimerase [Phycisphaerae bacterium]
MDGGRRYQLGLVTYNLAAQLDLPTCLKLCQDVGLTAIEFRTTHKHGVEPSLSREQREEVKKRCTDAGLRCWSLGSVCEFHSPDPQEVRKNIDTAKQFIDLAADIGAKAVKVRPNGLPPNVPVEKTLEQIGRSLATCGRMAADAGVEIWCEVHGKGTSEPAYMRKIMDVADHPAVGVTWNSNDADVKDGSIKESFELLRPKIYCCHISELIRPYPWRELFALLTATGYDRFTLIEAPAIGSGNPGDTARFLRYYKALWEELSRSG